MARGVGDSAGLLTYLIWCSLLEWCDGRTMNGRTLEMMQQRVPVRYLYGTRSGKYHDANRAAFAAHPDAAAAGVENAGHFMLTDDTPAALAAIRGLLTGLI